MGSSLGNLTQGFRDRSGRSNWHFSPEHAKVSLDSGMSWMATVLSATTAVCLTLAGVRFLVRVRSQGSWGNLPFAIALPTERTRLSEAGAVSRAFLRKQFPPTCLQCPPLFQGNTSGGIRIHGTAWDS